MSSVVKRKKELEQENRELRVALEKLEEELKRSEREREYLAFQMDSLKRMLFGRRSEKIPPRTDGLVQAELFEEAKEEIDAERLQELQEDEEDNKDRKRRRSRRRPIPEDIHREQIVVDVDPELRVCPDCGEEMECFGHDVSEELEYIPALLFIVEHLLKKYACKKCENVVQAQRPPRPIPKAKPGPGLLAYVLVSKYQDHLPLHRLERIFGRHGLALSRKTLCDWVQKMAELLQPIVETMKKDLLAQKLIQADETPLKVKNPEVKGKTSRAFIWTYGIPDKEVVYDFTMGRSASGPEEFFGGNYPKYIQSDSYSVYTSLEKQGKTLHVGCWAHVRRKFFEARAEDPKFTNLILAAIQKLFRIEREAKEQKISGDELVELRCKEASPLLHGIKALISAKRRDVVPQSGIGDAIDYALENWEALKRYVEIPEARVSNNSAERSIRGVVVGRKNWLFIGHPNAGPRAAIIISLVETCARLGVEPYEYLKSVIAALAKDPAQAAELTPRKWKEKHDDAKPVENTGE